MNTVLIPPGPGGYGKGLWLPTGSGKKVLSLTGREIHPVAIEIGALTESEVVNGFADIPPDNDILCVVINCAGSLRCGLYPQKGIPTINVLPTWRAGPLAHFISEENYVSGVTIEQLVLVDTAEAPDCQPESVPAPEPVITTAPPPPRGAEKLVRMVEQTGTAVGHVIALLFAASREAVDVSLRNVYGLCLAADCPGAGDRARQPDCPRPDAAGELTVGTGAAVAHPRHSVSLPGARAGCGYLAGDWRDDWHTDWRRGDISGLRPARPVCDQCAGRLRLRACWPFDAGGKAGDHRKRCTRLSAVETTDRTACGNSRLAVFPGLILRT